MITATGVNASASAARWAATSPAHLRTSRWRISTEPTPAAAWGSRMLHELKPKIRADTVCTQKAAGGLSTVMNDPGSIAPKKNAFQLFVPALTAAASYEFAHPIDDNSSILGRSRPDSSGQGRAW